MNVPAPTSTVPAPATILQDIRTASHKRRADIRNCCSEKGLKYRTWAYQEAVASIPEFPPFLPVCEQGIRGTAA